MSYFLCLAVPPQAESLLAQTFDARVVQVGATSFPIGAATRGRNLDWKCVLLQYGSSSAFLVGKGTARRTHNNDRTGLLIDGVRRLLEQNGIFDVRLVLHWFLGPMAEEEVRVVREERVRCEEWGRGLAGGAELQENVRYIIES